MQVVLELILLLLDLFKFVLFATIIVSWLITFNILNTRQVFVIRLEDFLRRVTEPVLEPIRRVVRPINGIDFSALIALIAIWFIEKLIITYLMPVSF